MTADDLRSIPEACDAAGNCVGWVPVPVATRHAIADLIDAARRVNRGWGPGIGTHDAWLEACSALNDALAALDGTP